ncbi:MAG: MarR family transcriptional regulator [Paludibacteraceae bacterium]|nr:MarR family transcriptional regulator [Paludibacteraceae bacterium]
MAGKSFYFSIQSWMLDAMDLSLSEAAVYAYIHGLTRSEELGKKGWHGSIRRLAKVLHTSPSTMNDIVNRLEARGFLHFANGFITSTINRDLASGTPTDNATEIPIDRNPDIISDDKPKDIPF